MIVIKVILRIIAHIFCILGMPWYWGGGDIAGICYGISEGIYKKHKLFLYLPLLILFISFGVCYFAGLVMHRVADMIAPDVMI